MLPEVFECPHCQRQFVLDTIETRVEDQSVYCPQCKHYMGERDVEFILRSEIEELIERLDFERDRLEKDEAFYSLGECADEMRFYGNEVHKIVRILRDSVRQLERLRQEYVN